MLASLHSERRPCSLSVFLLAAVALLQADVGFAASNAEAGGFFIQQFSPKSYGQSPQNWGAAQDARGVMFFANTSGVLEYDGAAWRTISVNGSGALSVAVGPTGTVYVGSQEEFGYLEPDASGGLRFVSLASQVDSKNPHFGNVRNITCEGSSVWFTTAGALYHWRSDRKFLSQVPAPGVVRTYSLDGELYVSSRTAGLSRITGATLTPVPGLDAVPKKPIWGMTKFGDSIIISTADELFRQEFGQFVPWRTEASDLLKGAGIYSLVALSNGQLGVGTLRRGLILLNGDGSISRVVDQRSGLRSDAIHALFEDRQRGLWLALERGIARIEAQSPLTLFGDLEGIGENVYSIRRYQGKIYAATSVGLSYLEPSTLGLLPKFKAVDGISERVTLTLPVDDELMAGTASRLLSIKNGEPHPVVDSASSGTVYDLARSTINPEILYSVGTAGLYVLRRDASGWKQIRSLKPPDREFRSVVEDSDGSLWIAVRSAVYRVNWKAEPMTLETFDQSKGVSDGWINAYKVGGKVVFATSKGLLRFDLAKRRFVPDLDFGNRAADGSHAVSLFRESPNGNIWISGAGYQAILVKQANGSYLWQDQPLARAAINEIYALYLDDDNTAWAAGMDGGLVRLVDQQKAIQPYAPGLLLRRVEFLRSKRLVLDGEQPPSPSLNFHYADNALRFEFSLPDYEDSARTQYQVWLKGLDHDWSSWSSETQKEYTNLYEKQYSLLLRARNFRGGVTAPVSFSFRIHPPWYRTWWSFILYFACLLGAVATIIRLRLSQLAERNSQLEQMITNRTSKIREQRDQIQQKEKETNRLLLNILPPQVADELRTTGKVKPVSCSDVAICFTDFVGFTLSSETMTAERLVKALDLYFVAFDKVIDAYGLEKLKTIGDAYMFVGGLPEQKKSFAVDTVLAALDLVEVVERFGESEEGVGWKVRVGVNCGSAIAGVVGSKKFAFDIWGDSVNLASRMESSGRANSVNISVDTYALVKDFIECESRGLVKTKEGRFLEMYFARGLRQELAKDNRLPFESLYRERFGRPAPLPTSMRAAEQESSHQSV